MAYPELKLSNQICFLVYRLEHEIMARYRPLLQEIGLTYPQYLVMLVLWELEGRSVGDICGVLGLDTGTVSPLLKRLESAGWLLRSRDGNDERSVTIHLTDAGHALEERARAIPENLAACLDLDARQYANLHGTLSAMLSRL